MSNNSLNTQMAEAPASWNTRNVSPEVLEYQLTLRAERGSDLLEKVNRAIAYLLNNDCVPYSYNRGGYRGPTTNKSFTGPARLRASSVSWFD